MVKVYPKPSSAASNIWTKPRHESAARALVHALTLGDADGWIGALAIWGARLEAEERAAIAWAALKDLPFDTVEDVAGSVLGCAAGSPGTYFLGPMDEAIFWADRASRNELKAYALASFRRMSASDQAAFLRHVGERAAA